MLFFVVEYKIHCQYSMNGREECVFSIGYKILHVTITLFY